MNDLALDVIDLLGQGYSFDEVAERLSIPRKWVVFTAYNRDEVN